MSFNFQIEESKKIKGVYIIIPSVHEDLRGNIWSSFYKEEIEKLLPEGLFFKHDKFSQSKFNVLRGIHGDENSWKLVTCVYGDIDQVVVDYRKESKTYLKWEKFNINRKNQILVLLPPMMGNAYYVKSSIAVYHYKLAYKGDYIDANKQFTIEWNNPEIGIKWDCENPILSERDRKSY